jgi:hypothetical protein
LGTDSQAGQKSIVVRPQSFSFSDGLTTINEANSEGAGTFLVTTDSSGSVVGWDIYIKTEMTSGRMAFLGNTAAIIYEAILNRAPILLSRLKPELPPKLEEIVNMALEKDRKLRYQNAADIRTDLLSLKRDKGLTRVSAR